ncbi:MAG TPA: L,D-transpeptidase family protein [Novosphingobium sp.]|nr:L,D-transpeptidase family protein [Novosphingobium sp.]
MTKATVCHRRRSTARLLLAPVAFALALGLAPAGLLLAAPAQAQQVVPRDDLRAALVEQAPRELAPFYAAHGWQPLWLYADGRVRRAALLLLGQVEQAGADGIRPSRLRPGELRKALDRIGSADPKNLARVELAASRLYVNWVKALRSAPHASMQYESDALAPVVPTTAAALQVAAAAQSLNEHVETMAWMHPWYALLRQATLDPGLSESQRHHIALNMERLRALPAYPADRYVLVDAAGAKLWMFERGKPVGSMRVVVGKPDNQTPMMAGFIRYAILNPYWNVPDDLVSRRIASNVRNKGFGYLKTGGYEVLREWGSSETINPALVDWQAVEQGRAMVRVRQLPGRSNFMGKVKFEFPNPLGIYLHDTPEKNLLRQETRTASSGCVRLEDAQRLGRWLLGKPLPRKVSTPEKRMDLPELVPVYITYLTISPEPSGTLAFNADPYGRDGGMTHLATR